MGKHDKKEDLNNKPYDQGANPQKKADEFSQQYGQNRKGQSSTPALDAYKKKNK